MCDGPTAGVHTEVRDTDPDGEQKDPRPARDPRAAPAPWLNPIGYPMGPPGSYKVLQPRCDPI